MTRSGALILLGVLLAGGPTLTCAQPFTATDLVALKRVSDPQLAPDGKSVAFVVWEPGADGEGLTQVWLREFGDVAAVPRPLTQHAASSWSPRWAPDGRSLYFLSALSGTAQVWRLPLRGGGEAARVTDYPLEVGTFNVFSARIADAGEAWSTNFDLYETAVDGKTAPRNLTSANPAWDTQPVFLPDGNLAYIATSRAGVESDRFTIRVRDARSGVSREVAGDWDRSIRRFAVAGTGKLLATVDDQGQTSLFSINIATGKVERIVAEGQVSEFSAVADEIVVAWASLASPPDLYLARRGQGLKRMTALNEVTLQARKFSAYEPFGFAGWNDERVLGYVVKPFDFQSGRRYPVAFVVHGGPESSFLNRWDWRWNPQVLAGHGYAVVMIDFHGSSGYGREFIDSIAKDWGGKPLVDLQKGLAAALERFSWLDPARMCSLGPSYGGYMQNWIESEWSAPFKCLVNHAGIFDIRSMYYTTDELWFMDWENGGPYFQGQASLEQFNPVAHVNEWKTPMLVIHGGLDYRVPYSQGLAAFSALQRRGVHSRFL